MGGTVEKFGVEVIERSAGCVKVLYRTDIDVKTYYLLTFFFFFAKQKFPLVCVFNHNYYYFLLWCDAF